SRGVCLSWGRWWRRWVSSGSSGDGLEKRGEVLYVVAVKKEFAFLALQLAFSSVFPALLTETALDYSRLRHASRFCLILF
nr:hypothetical protein [Tanacetum cinerariifolium]